MAMTLPTAEDLFEETVRKVSSTPQEWLKFLNTASRVYQYTFDAQLMIYAQRPNAIGCTSFEKENELRSVQERLTKINAELDMKPKEEPKKMIKKEELKKCL